MVVSVASTRDRAAAYLRLQPVQRRAVDAATVPEMADGCLVLDVIEDGATVGAVALDLQGDTATITAAANTGAHTWRALALIEAGLKQRGVRRLRLFTKRRGLIAALVPKGYRIAACELTKEL